MSPIHGRVPYVHRVGALQARPDSEGNSSAARLQNRVQHCWHAALEVHSSDSPETANMEHSTTEPQSTARAQGPGGIEEVVGIFSNKQKMCEISKLFGDNILIL